MDYLLVFSIKFWDVWFFKSYLVQNPKENVVSVLKSYARRVIAVAAKEKPFALSLSLCLFLNEFRKRINESEGITMMFEGGGRRGQRIIAGFEEDEAAGLHISMFTVEEEAAKGRMWWFLGL